MFRPLIISIPPTSVNGKTRTPPSAMWVNAPLAIFSLTSSPRLFRSIVFTVEAPRTTSTPPMRGRKTTPLLISDTRMRAFLDMFIRTARPVVFHSIVCITLQSRITSTPCPPLRGTLLLKVAGNLKISHAISSHSEPFRKCVP